MVDNIKNKAKEAGRRIADTAKDVGHKIAEGAEKAADWVKEKAHLDSKESFDTGKLAGASAKSTAEIRPHMEVFGSCGKLVGKVDRVEGISIKLTKDSPRADGEHRYIPVGWVERVDQHVHLTKPCGDVQEEWQAHPVAEGEYVTGTK